MTGKDWGEDYKNTNSKPPRPILVQAVKFLNYKDKAIDIGAGALNETRFLLEEGFDVTVIDKNSLTEQEAEHIRTTKLHPYTVSYEDFNFPKEEYDLAAALFALPFAEPQHFDQVFKNIVDSVKVGGIFCGQLFGERDEWASNPKMTFHERHHVNALLMDFEILFFEEEEKDGKTAAGQPKHWHIFHFIVRK